MSTTQSLNPSIDPELEAAVRDWTPRDAGAETPSVSMEPLEDGLRVRLTYLGVETGVVFARSLHVAKPAVQRTLDRLFDVLSWRVLTPRV